MFLTSDAFRRFDQRRLQHWDWSAAPILLVSHDWDPDANAAEALAGRRLAAALLEAGARLHVLAAGRPRHDFQAPNYAITVVPTRAFPVNKIARAARMIRTTVPESEGSWLADAVAAGTRILAALSEDTIIYSRAMPGVSNVVGWTLSRAARRPWVAHFSDEWPLPYVLANGRRWLAPYKAPMFRRWRRRILRDAGALTFTNPSQACDVLGGSGARYESKSFVVTHLAEFPPQAMAPDFETFHIVHTGNLYPGRSSAALMQGLRQFIDRTPAAAGRVRVTLAGWDYGDLPMWTMQCGLSDVVRFAGRLDQRDTAALTRAATLLVAFDFARTSSTTLLSKMPDYLHARRPILAIASRSSAMGRLFHEDGAGMTAAHDRPDEVANHLGRLFEAWRAGDLGPLLPAQSALTSFARDRVLAQLSAAFLTARDAFAAEQPLTRRLRLDPDRVGL